MSWLRLDDNFTHHPKILQLSVRDRWTWLDLLCYCARYRTGGGFARGVGGVIPGVTPAFVKRCLELGLVDEIEKGYRVHDWAIYNGETIAVRVAAFLKDNPDATANQVFKIVGGTRDVVLAEVAKARHGGTGAGTEGGTTVVLPPAPSFYKRPLPSAGTPSTSHVCPHPTCGVRKKTALKLLEHLADVHGDEAALAEIHELEARK